MTTGENKKKSAGLIFVCPEKGATFSSAHFKIVENNGIKTDADGNKTLDAKVIIEEPCPFCSKQHVYHVSEIPCPFNG
ncbi:hypothetical protein JW935_09720 [candidate division KSB1 bacterium]|nr:hypothetical protein [candidate division KSB1 bacterium]